MSSDGGDYSVPCGCGGWVRYVEDVEQPHTHRPSRHDAEVAALTAQLQAAQATIAEVLACIGDADQGDSFGPIEDILSHVDTSAHDAAILAAKTEALREAANDIEPNSDVDPETVTTIFDPYDVADWLRARAASIEQTEAK